jgi:hypothetical protein
VIIRIPEPGAPTAEVGVLYSSAMSAISTIIG